MSAHLIAPAGYARTHFQFVAVACQNHTQYAIGCASCTYVETELTVPLTGDTLALILDREDNSVLEYVTTYSAGYEIAHLAHDGVVVIREDMQDHPTAQALITESALVADCYGLESPTLAIA